jgi:hypothetical protein
MLDSSNETHTHTAWSSGWFMPARYTHTYEQTHTHTSTRTNTRTHIPVCLRRLVPTRHNVRVCLTISVETSLYAPAAKSFRAPVCMCVCVYTYMGIFYVCMESLAYIQCIEVLRVAGCMCACIAVPHAHKSSGHLCMCMYVYTCTSCLYVSMMVPCTWVLRHIHAYMHTCIHAYMHTCIHGRNSSFFLMDF